MDYHEWLNQLKSSSADEKSSDDEQGLPQLQAAVLDFEGLKGIERPQFLIEGWLYRNSLAWLAGPPGSGKSFFAIDLACSIATGLAWHEHAVNQGSVLYIIAEGTSGLYQRVHAWYVAHGQTPNNIDFLPIAIQLSTEPDFEQLKELINYNNYTFVAIDTQARTTLGLDENSNKDMSSLVDRLEELRQVAQSCILCVHHTPRKGDNLRGATALEGAAESILTVSKDGPIIKLTNPKQKNAPTQDDLMFTLQPIADSASLIRGTAMGILAESSHQMLSILWESGGNHSMTKTDLRRATGLTDTTFYRALNDLVNRGLATEEVYGRSKIITAHMGPQQLRFP